MSIRRGWAASSRQAVGNLVRVKSFLLAAFALALSGLSSAQVAPPHLHYAPDRSYHLVRTVTTLDLDTDHQRASGSVSAEIFLLRDGVTSVHFDTSADQVSDVLCDGKPTKFTRLGGSLEVDLHASRRGDVHRLNFTIAGRFFRWTTPTAEEPTRIGFCAEGLPAQPVGWAPPNDLSSTEIQVTCSVSLGRSSATDRRFSDTRRSQATATRSCGVATSRMPDISTVSPPVHSMCFTTVGGANRLS